jgi:hypothetical protein
MIEGGWVPQDEEEESLMEDIHYVTRKAHSRGVSRRRIASLCAFMASAAIDPRSDANAESAEADGADGNLGGTSDSCPKCGDYVDSHVTGMGGPIELRPCGCTFEQDEWDELLGVVEMVEDFVDTDEDDETA